MRTSILVLAVCGGVLGTGHAGHADRVAPTLLIDTPFLLDGELVTPEFYFGRISIAARTNDPAFGTGRIAELSLDGGLTFSPAQIERGSPVVRVNTQTLLQQVAPTTAALARDGGFVVSWTSFGNDGDNLGVFAQRYNTSGAPVGLEVQVNTTTLSSQSQPAAAGLQDGGFVIAWESLGEAGGSSFEVMAQRYNDAGARVGGQFRVNDTSSNAQFAAAVAGLEDGGFVVAWQSNQGGPGSHIFAKRYDAAGAPVPPSGGCQGGCEFRVDNLLKGSQIDPAVAGLATGGFVITWTGQGSGDAGDDEVYVAHYDAQGKLAQPVALLRSAQPPERAEQDQRTTAVARWRDGFVAVWSNQSTTSAGLDVFLQAFTADGVPVFGASELAVNTTTQGDQSAPSIVNLSDGSLVVAWQDASQATRVIRAQRYNAALVPVGGELDVSATVDGRAANPAIAGLSDGSFAVAWEATGNPADLSSAGIFARRLSDTLLVSRDLSPARDIAIQFRLTDHADPTQVFLSPVRLYRFGDPNGGSDGQIGYPDGFTRDDRVEVGLVLPTISIGYQGIQLFQRVAALAGGACGAFGDWQAFGQQTTLVRSVVVPLDDATCRQFKLRVVNGLGRVFEYTSLHAVAADRTPPAVVASPEQLGSILRVAVATVETAAGIAAQAYRLNGGAAVAFSGNQVLLPLQDGGNSVRIEVTDRAGNVGAAHLFFSAELSAPAIDIQSIDEGATYARGPTLAFSLSQPMTQVTVLVDGAVVDTADLSFLGAGSHTLVIRALDSGGHVVEKSVTFQIDGDAFHPVLLSPQARTYPEDEITVTFTADRPVVDRQILLDGNLQTSPRLTGLGNGDHTVTVHVRADSGATADMVRTFRVSTEAPTLAIASPRDGQRLTSRSLPVIFDSNSAVRYEAGGVGDRVVSGDIITLPADGTQQITLTATRPGGGTLSRTIIVTVDSTTPSFTVVSPRPQLYAASTIPIDYVASKLLRSVVTRLDGVEVTALDNLPDGAHVLEIVGEDLDGRTARSSVAFQVAHLAIVAPHSGENVIDNHIPPAVALQWDAGGSFTFLTASVDGGEPVLLPADRNTTQLQLPGGPHEIVVRGAINELALARSVRFRSGARNVRVNENSIKYTFTNCTDDLICDVNVTLQIENVGEYDLAETFPVIFEVISAGDAGRVLEWVVDGIAAKETRSATLTPFRARLDDTFRITIDPDRSIPAEDLRDNTYEVLFQPGKILQVEHSLSASNFYLSGSRTDNLFAVATAGPVAFVEFTAGDLVFRDSTGEQGFVSPVDMGLLTPAANHVVIKAFDANNHLLDSRIEYFDVKALHDSYPMPDRPSPWSLFRGAGNRIFVDAIDQRQFARAELQWVRDSLSEDAITISSADAGADAAGRQLLRYHLVHSDAPSLRRAESSAVRAPSPASPSGLQGTKAIGAFTTLDVTSGACMVGGFSPITSSEGHRRAVLAGLDEFATVANVLIDTELEPLLENQIGHAFNDIQRVFEPLTHGFGFAVILPGFFAFAVGDLDIIPPNISDVHFQFVGDVEDFVFQAPPPKCDIQIVGSEIRIDSSVAFDMRFRRKFTVSANASGEASGFLVGGLGFDFPIPSLAIFSFTTVDLRAIGPTFVGAISSNLHYRGGLHGSLAEPSLTIDEADVFLGFRVPLQTQRVAEGEAHSYLWTPLVFWLIVGLEVELEAYAELQAETVLDGHLQAPITLSNPSYRAGDLPDTDSFTSPLGHVFAKARALVTTQFSACVFFICVPVKTKHDDVPLIDTCQKVDHRALIPGVPGTDCPTEVSQFAFSF